MEKWNLLYKMQLQRNYLHFLNAKNSHKEIFKLPKFQITYWNAEKNRSSQYKFKVSTNIPKFLKKNCFKNCV